MSQRRDVQRRRAAARRQLPPAEDHREGKLRQSQTGQTLSDRPRGENTVCLYYSICINQIELYLHSPYRTHNVASCASLTKQYYPSSFPANNT